MKISKLVLASGNAGKLAELQSMLGELGIEVVSQRQLDIADAIEDGLSFVENSLIKARHASRLSGLPAIADDSGLCVTALKGEPGIYSARYGGEDTTDLKNIEQLLANLAGYDQRQGYFHCALTLVTHADDPQPIICEGSWHGEIATAVSGDQGFGYDPVFYLPELAKTAAQLTKAEKSAISHRGLAMAKLIPTLQTKGYL